MDKPLASFLRTPGKGLTKDEVEKSRTQFGENALQRPKPRPLLLKILSGLNDPIIRILLAALAINFVFLFKTFDLYETVGILLAILCATIISAVSERGGELAFEAMLREAAESKCIVRRDGKEQKIAQDAIVVGDVVRLEAGMKLPADGILLEGVLGVDQSALNGESIEVQKQPTRIPPREFTLTNPHTLFRGSTVVHGSGLLWVTRVGQASLYGSLGKELSAKGEKSPLKTRLEHLAKQMSIVGYAAALLVALSYLVNAFFIDNGWNFAKIAALLRTPSYLFPQLLHALTLATTVIVVAVPEGLPMMISVVLSRNVRRMKKDRVLVRCATGIETAGSLNLLFTDKTGTLTRGCLSVDSLLFAGDEPKSIAAARKEGARFRLYERAARYNTACTVLRGRASGGNATERAILASVLPFSERENLSPGDRLSFDSERKFAAVTVEKARYYTGAPEVLLPRVNAFIDRKGEPCPLAGGTELLSAAEPYAARGFRILCILCERDGLCCFLCFVLLRDGLRRDAKTAVKELTQAGVRVVMITGDNEKTARSIAAECGIMRRGGVVMDGKTLQNTADEELIRLLPRLCVIARALPGDKSRLVRLAQKAGYVVGMTGDGINDAPALKCADVGFAMGSGTDIAKEAGDIIITDNAISSIAKAVLYGRTIFKSIRKFILFQMTTNLSAVAITTICPLLGIDTPITVLQMLWINMIMDTFGSLAFATEAPMPQYMKEAPLARSGGIMNRYMALRIAFVGALMTTLSLCFLRLDCVRAAFPRGGDAAVMQCAFFLMFIAMDLCNFLSARTTGVNPLRDISKNPSFILIFLFICTVQLFMIYFGGHAFRTTPLAWHELWLCIGYGGTLLIFSGMLKPILRKLCRGRCV